MVAGLTKGINGLDRETVYQGVVGNIAIGGVVFDVNVEDKAFMAMQLGAPTGGALPGAGTAQIEGTIDGVNWVAVPYGPAQGGATAITALALTAAGIWVMQVSAFRRVRGRLTVATTGGTTLPYLTLFMQNMGVRLV